MITDADNNDDHYSHYFKEQNAECRAYVLSSLTLERRDSVRSG